MMIPARRNGNGLDIFDEVFTDPFFGEKENKIIADNLLEFLMENNFLDIDYSFNSEQLKDSINNYDYNYGNNRPSRPEPSRPRPDRLRPQPSRPEPQRPEPSRPQPSRPEPSRPEPSRPQPSKVRTGRTTC